MRRGNIFVVSAPSGAGKSSLVKAVTQLDSTIQLSISHTTRPRRNTEQDGIDYFFITLDTFNQLLEQKQFIEYAKVYEHYYGTCLNNIQTCVEQGRDIILEIDCQGAAQIKKTFPTSILIYILPPSLQILKDRLYARNTDSSDVIQQRLNLATADMAHAKYFDFAVINDNFNLTVQHLYSIMMVHRWTTPQVLSTYSFTQ